MLPDHPCPVFCEPAAPWGAVGRAVRRVLNWPGWRPGLHADRGVRIDPSAVIRQARNVHIGPQSRIGAGCRLLTGPDSQIALGRHCRLGPGVVLDATQTDRPSPAAAWSRHYPHIILGDGVTVGAGARIAAGVRIADGATIAPGAVVEMDVLVEGALVPASPQQSQEPLAAAPQPVPTGRSAAA